MNEGLVRELGSPRPGNGQEGARRDRLAGKHMAEHSSRVPMGMGWGLLARPTSNDSRSLHRS
jgi:hypothetical protein